MPLRMLYCSVRRQRIYSRSPCSERLPMHAQCNFYNLLHSSFLGFAREQFLPGLKSPKGRQQCQTSHKTLNTGCNYTKLRHDIGYQQQTCATIDIDINLCRCGKQLYLTHSAFQKLTGLLNRCWVSTFAGSPITGVLYKHQVLPKRHNNSLPTVHWNLVLAGIVPRTPAHYYKQRIAHSQNFKF